MDGNYQNGVYVMWSVNLNKFKYTLDGLQVVLKSKYHKCCEQKSIGACKSQGKVFSFFYEYNANDKRESLLLCRLTLYILLPFRA